MKNVGRLWLERRLARIFGMDAALAGELLTAARNRDDGRLMLRTAAFLAATTRLSPHLVPRALRERAIRSFVWWLFGWNAWNPHLASAYAGKPRGLSSQSCAGLLQ